MSRVYWHTPSETVELLGMERTWAAKVIDDLAIGILNPFSPFVRDELEPLLPQDSYMRSLKPDIPAAQWGSAFAAFWRVGDERLRLPDGTSVNPFDVVLNTALVAGSDSIEFLARLHGTCEIHGYVEGEHREWLAEIIEEARGDKVLRDDWFLSLPEIVARWYTPASQIAASEIDDPNEVIDRLIRERFASDTAEAVVLLIGAGLDRHDASMFCFALHARRGAA